MLMCSLHLFTPSEHPNIRTGETAVESAGRESKFIDQDYNSNYIWGYNFRQKLYPKLSHEDFSNSRSTVPLRKFCVGRNEVLSF